MTLFELRFKEHKRIRRASWPKDDYLSVKGWGYNGSVASYEPGGDAPYGWLHIEGGNRDIPFDVQPGHPGTDWEIV